MAPPLPADAASPAGPGVRRRADQAAGIYLHVPFCARLCPYCDFAVDVRATIPHAAYATAVQAEWRARRAWLDGRAVRTLYVGGGTPSLWSLDAFASTTGAILADLPDQGAAVVEFAMEANPNEVTPARLEAWREAGVTRLSIGVQSFQPHVLRALNRNHSAAQARQAVERALDAGFETVSFDLIFGCPAQSMADWQADLDLAQGYADAGLNHLSSYHLTIEPRTAFWRRRERGRLKLPAQELPEAMLEALVERTGDWGFRRYEVSNFARPGHESQHNTLYWTGAEYLGLGVGAHGLHIDDAGRVIRRANPRRTADYLAAPGEPAEVERLGPDEHLVERLFTGVRTAFGLDFDALVAQFDQAVSAETLAQARAALDRMVDEGFVTHDAATYRPTNRGLDFADLLGQRFYEAVDI